MTVAMPILRTLAAIAALFLTPALAAAEEAFLAELEDVPLAPGLTEAPGGLLFDSADGRIVEAQASGEVPPEQLRQYYRETLTQLGWQNSGDMEFRRDNEVLRIRLDRSKKPLVVRFTLAPNR